MQEIEVHIPHIKYTSGIELRGKVRDGEKFYTLDGRTVEKIITQHMAEIKRLQEIIATNAIKGVKNESHRTAGESRVTGNKFGSGYGD